MKQSFSERLGSAWTWRVSRPWQFAGRFVAPALDGFPQARWGYLGYVGHRNYGDDVLFDAITHRLLPGPRHETVDMQPFPRSLLGGVDLARYDAVVLGGGTLIYREAYLHLVERALERGLPLFVMGTGVSDVDYWKDHLPDVRFDDLVARWDRALQCATLVGVRGPRSLEALHARGISSAEMIGDPALSVTAGRELRATPEGPIGINLGTHDPIWGDQDRLNDEVVRFAQGQIAEGRQIHFISMSPIDTRVGEAIGRKLGSPAYAIVERPEEIEPAIARCGLVIGQRLHAVILACAYGVPALSLSYQPKCLDFLESIACPELSLKTDQITSGRLSEFVTGMKDGWASTSARIVTAVRRFQEVQRAFGARALAVPGKPTLAHLS